MTKTSFLRDPLHLAEGLLNAEFVHIPTGKEEPGYTLAYHHETFYEWDAGVWSTITDDEVRCLITRHLRKIKQQSGDENSDVRITTSTVANIMLCLKELTHIPAGRELNSWPFNTRSIGVQSLAMKNGVLLFSPDKLDPGLALKTHSPHFFNVAKLPYNFDPDAVCPMWESFLITAMCNNQEFITLLQQWAGYLLLPDMRFHKFLLCVGEGANGKSVFVTVLQNLIGEMNVSSVPLSRFGCPFSLYGTYGKLLNATDETGHMVQEESEAALKRYVTGQTMNFERKYRDSFEGRPTAKLVVCTNSLPRFNDKTSGTWRRVLLVPWDYVVPQEDQIPNLAEEICRQELPGVFNWAMAGLKSLVKNNGFIKPGRVDELMEGYRKDSDPARAFLLDNYVHAPNATGTLCTGLYDEYRAYCGENGYRPVGSRTFGKQIKRVFPQVTRSRPGGGNSRAWIYEGLIPSASHASQGFSY